jgi:hypothetical protein
MNVLRIILGAQLFRRNPMECSSIMSSESRTTTSYKFLNAVYFPSVLNISRRKLNEKGRYLKSTVRGANPILSGVVVQKYVYVLPTNVL